MTFDQWFNQTEAFSLRGERFYDDLITLSWQETKDRYLPQVGR